MALKDFPEIKTAFDRLMQEKEFIRSRTVSMHEKRNALRLKIDQLRKEEESLVQQIRAIELPRLAQIDDQLSVMAAATGGRRLSESVTPAAE